MDYEKYRVLVESAWLLVNVWLLAWTYWSNKQKATTAEIKELRDMISMTQTNQARSCASHQGRTTALEVRVQNAPTHRDIAEVHEKVNDVKSSVDKMSGILGGIDHQLKLLVAHHLKGENE